MHVDVIRVGLPVAGLDTLQAMNHEAAVGLDEGQVVASFGGTHCAPEVTYFAFGD